MNINAKEFLDDVEDRGVDEALDYVDRCNLDLNIFLIERDGLLNTQFVNNNVQYNRQNDKDKYNGFVYHLLLEHNKHYVGFSRTFKSLMYRFVAHEYGGRAKWTSKYKPIKIMNIFANKGLEYETQYTIELMHKYGVDNVRGGPYCKVELSHGMLNGLEYKYGLKNLTNNKQK